MLFKFIEKPIIIEAFVDESHCLVKECSPILPSSRFIPKWWRDMPRPDFDIQKFNINFTAKGCTGISDTYKIGYVQPMWVDTRFFINRDEWRIWSGSGREYCNVHLNMQIPNFYDDHLIVKFRSPWVIKTSKELKFMFSDHFYSSNVRKPYITPYGIKQTLEKKMATNFFIFIPKIYDDSVTDFTIKTQTPMIHLIPLTDKTTTLKTEIITHQEWNKLQNSIENFSTFYDKAKWARSFIKRVRNGKSLI